MQCTHSQAKQSRRPDLLLEAEKDCNAKQLVKLQQAQEAAEHAAAHDKQRADDLQHQLAAVQQEHQRLKTSLKAQSCVLEKTRSTQDEMADVLLSLKQECEEKGRKLAAASKRACLLKDKLGHAERHLADAQHHTNCLEEQARSVACNHQQSVTHWQNERERLRSSLASTQQQLQEACANYESNAAASGEAYQALQARQQALQASLADQSMHIHAGQHRLEQQASSLQTELTAVQQERDTAVAGLKALQTCDEKSKCSLHVNLTQVGQVRQQVIEAHRQCSHQQGTIVQLHAHLLSSQQQLQAKEAELQAHCKQQQHAFRKVILQREKLDPTQQENLQDPGTAAESGMHASLAAECAAASEKGAALRHDLSAAREAEVFVMRSLQSELRRVHALERMCLNDVTEINTLHQQLHASQRSAWSLRESVLKCSLLNAVDHSHARCALLPALLPPCQ